MNATSRPADPANFTPVQIRLLAKLRTKGLTVASHNDSCVRTNPFSSKQVQLCPLAASLVDWIVSPNRGDNISRGIENRNDWDRARYLFLALWPDAYYDLID